MSSDSSAKYDRPVHASPTRILRRPPDLVGLVKRVWFPAGKAPATASAPSTCQVWAFAKLLLVFLQATSWQLLRSRLCCCTDSRLLLRQMKYQPTLFSQGGVLLQPASCSSQYASMSHR